MVLTQAAADILCSLAAHHQYILTFRPYFPPPTLRASVLSFCGRPVPRVPYFLHPFGLDLNTDCRSFARKALSKGTAMSYSDYEEDSEVELEAEAHEPVEDPLMKEMVNYCKYG